MRKQNAPLNPGRFDALVEGSEKLWGLTTIAAVLGVSVDKARRLAKIESTPIYRPDGRSYFAFRSELRDWLRSK
ncbi:DNA-binding protein [Roseovarius sp. A46]|nr:DNA-binding protein [Roseovarius sp. A46]